MCMSALRSIRSTYDARESQEYVVSMVWTGVQVELGYSTKAWGSDSWEEMLAVQEMG